MKRTFSTVAALVVAGGLTLGAGSAASAVTFWFGSTPCTTTESPTGTTAKSSRGSCDSVRSRIQYRDSGGTLRTSYGSWGSTSTASATTTMVTGRAVNAQYRSSTYGFVSY